MTIGLSLRHLVLALVVATIVYIIREIRRYRVRVNPRRPDLTMVEAVELCARSGASSPDRVLWPVGARAGDGARIDAAVERAVFAVEREALGSPNPRLSVRQAILANATLGMQLDAIAEQEEEARRALIKGYQPGMARLLEETAAACHQAWFILRTYARWKFDDAVASDWFHHYVLVARPYVREKVRLAKEAVLHMDESAERFAAVYDTLLAELQEKMRKAPPKKRFVRPDLP